MKNLEDVTHAWNFFKYNTYDRYIIFQKAFYFYSLWFIVYEMFLFEKKYRLLFSRTPYMSLTDQEYVKFEQNTTSPCKRTRAHIRVHAKYTENAENARRNSRDRDEGVVGKRRGEGYYRMGKGE